MIDYLKLGQSIEYYKKIGYVPLDAPWMVTEEISKITKPPEAKDYHVLELNKVLVGSAEQSFLYLATKGLLPPGKYQATTPCFRYEPIDLLHKKCFIKTELINTSQVNEDTLNEMIKEALSFFSLYIDPSMLKVVKEPAYQSIISYDIVAMVNGKELELGSYGIRKCEILKWVYGTGLAEPRLSAIMNRIKINKEGHNDKN